MVAGIMDEGQIPLHSSTGICDLKEMWKSLIPQLRILCLAAAHDKTSMWYHYADKYRGVVIELACIDKLDSPWLVAEPVEYPLEHPSVFTASGWAELLTLKQEIGLEKMLHALTYNKTPDWSYEEEWRVSSYRRPGEVAEYADYKIHPLNLTKVFFGPDIAFADKEEILNFLVGDLSHVIPYQASIGFGRYLHFEQMQREKG
jgi:hypothetical protein